MGLSVKTVFDWRNKTKKPTETGSVSIRVILDRKTFYINTGIKIAKIHWNNKKHEINSNCPNYLHIVRCFFNCTLTVYV